MDNDTSGWVGGDRLIEHVSDMYFILYGFCQQLFRLYTHLHLLFFLSCDHGNRTMLVKSERFLWSNPNLMSACEYMCFVYCFSHTSVSFLE